jgi:hypothetical protein
MLWFAAHTVLASAEKPSIVVALGMTREQVQQQSTLRIPWQLIPVGGKQRRGGGTLVNTPHRLTYEDATLRLVVPDAGNHISMPTGIIVAFDAIDLVSASVLGEYVNLKSAIVASKSLLAEVLAQGFEYGPLDPANLRYPKFLLARKNTFAEPSAPRTVDSFEEMEQVFLNSRYYLMEFLVFVLVKGELRVSLRVTNMRRAFTENRISLDKPNITLQQRSAREFEERDEAFLRNERAYHLEVSIAKR